MPALIWLLSVVFGALVIVTTWLLLVVHRDNPNVLQSIIFPERSPHAVGREASSPTKKPLFLGDSSIPNAEPDVELTRTIQPVARSPEVEKALAAAEAAATAAAAVAVAAAMAATATTDSALLDRPVTLPQVLMAPSEATDTPSDLTQFEFPVPPYGFAQGASSPGLLESACPPPKSAASSWTEDLVLASSSPSERLSDWEESSLASSTLPLTPGVATASAQQNVAGPAGDSTVMPSSFDRAMCQLRGELESTERECETLRQHIAFISSMREELHRETSTGLRGAGGGGAVRAASWNSQCHTDANESMRRRKARSRALSDFNVIGD